MIQLLKDAIYLFCLFSANDMKMKIIATTIL